MLFLLKLFARLPSDLDKLIINFCVLLKEKGCTYKQPFSFQVDPAPE